MEQTCCSPNNRQPASNVRKAYFARLVGRCALFLICVYLWIEHPGEFDILHGMSFFDRPSFLHIMWVLWVIDMICQLVPMGKKVSLGSHKLFKQRFKPILDKVNYTALREYISTTTKSAYKVMLLWLGLAAAIAGLYYTKNNKPHNNVYDNGGLFHMRSYLCADMVSLQAADEDPLLHHLQDIQLGAPHDVYSYDICKELLFMEPVFHGAAGVCGVGAVCADVPRALLGALKRCPEVRKLYR